MRERRVEFHMENRNSMGSSRPTEGTNIYMEGLS